MEENKLIEYFKQKEERDRIQLKKQNEFKLGLFCAGLILGPSLLPKGEGEW